MNKKPAKTDKPVATEKVATSEKKVALMQRYIGEVDRFASLLRETQDAIAERGKELALAKDQYEVAKDAMREAKDIEHNTVALLLKFIVPGSCDILPLFDTLEDADEELHGKNSLEWRSEPVAVLKLSAAALRALIDADIVLVGQLQDRMLASPDEWSKPLEISVGMAEAIAAKLHEFVLEKSQ